MPNIALVAILFSTKKAIFALKISASAKTVIQSSLAVCTMQTFAIAVDLDIVKSLRSTAQTFLANRARKVTISTSKAYVRCGFVNARMARRQKAKHAQTTEQRSVSRVIPGGRKPPTNFGGF